MRVELSPPYRVRTAGCCDRWPYHSTPGTRGPDVMLTAFLDGRGWYDGPDGRVAVRAGMIGLVPPREPGVLMAAAGEPYLHYWCRFGGDYALVLADSLVERAGARFVAVPHAASIADCIRRMGHISRRELPDALGHAEALLAQALALVEHGPAEDEPAPALSGQALEEHLRAHIAEPTDLAAIAEHFGVSRTTLSRHAARVHGCGVQQLHEHLKIDWAGTLLRRGLSVADTARRVGYADRRYFARVFRKRRGLSPRQWLDAKLGK